MSKILTVFGATGNQGGSIIRTVLGHPKLSSTYKIRAVTRDVTKPAAVALKDKGCELVTADLEKKETVLQAVRGSDVVYGVTNFWEKGIAEVEVAQGKNIADACKEAGVKFLIWSSLPNVAKLSSGKLADVYHFDSKADVEEYIRAQNIPSAFYMPAFYASNLNSTPKDSEGNYTLRWPMDSTHEFPMLDISDTGKFIAPILLDPAKFSGKRIAAASGVYSVKDICDTFEQVTGKKMTLTTVSDEAFEQAMPVPDALKKELAETFFLLRDYQYYGSDAKKQVDDVLKTLEEPPTSWRQYVEKHKW